MKENGLGRFIQNFRRRPTNESQVILDLTVEARLRKIEALTGMTVELVPFSKFKQEIDAIEAHEALRNFQPWMWGEEKADLGNPIVSDWMKVGEGRVRHTRFASSCFSGIVVNSTGEFKLFHLPSSWSWTQAPLLLPKSEIVDGFVGSHLSLNKNAFFQPPTPLNVEFYTAELGLVAIQNYGQEYGSFNVLADPEAKKVLCTYGY